MVFDIRCMSVWDVSVCSATITKSELSIPILRESMRERDCANRSIPSKFDVILFTTEGTQLTRNQTEDFLTRVKEVRE